jgi:hypothetical protein
MHMFTIRTHRGRIPAVAIALALALASPALAPARPANAQTFTVNLPELHVSQSWVQYQSSWLIPGAPGYFLIFDVRNTGPTGTGTADAGPFTVEVRNATSGYVVESFAVTGMKAGSGQRFWHKLPDPPDCDYAWSHRSILVDTAQVIAETNEGNNFTPANYQYGKGPCGPK